MNASGINCRTKFNLAHKTVEKENGQLNVSNEYATVNFYAFNSYD